MAIILSSNIPSSSIDETTGNTEVQAPDGAELELQDGTGSTQIKISDGLTSIGNDVLTINNSAITGNKPASMNNGLSITIDDVLDIPFKIGDINDNELFKITQDGNLLLNSTASINAIVNSFNDNTLNANNKLATIEAIISYIDSHVNGVQNFEFDTLTDYNNKVWTESDTPNLTFIFNSTAFNFTDDAGVTVSGVDWVQLRIHWHSGSAETHILTSSNTVNQLTATEIAALYHSVAEQYTTADKNKVDNTPTNTISELSSKLSISSTTSDIPPSTDRNYVTDAEQTKIGNLPLNVNTSLSDKLPVSSSGVNVTIENPGTGSGTLKIRNSNSPTDQKDFVIIGRSDGTMDIESRSDSDVVTNRWTFHADNGNTEFPSQIIQNGNNVLDASDTKYSNLPNDTNSELSNKVDIVVGKGLSTLDYIQSDKDKVDNLPSNTISELSNKANLTGATFTGDLLGTQAAFGTTTSTHNALNLQAPTSDNRMLEFKKNDGTGAWRFDLRNTDNNDLGILQVGVANRLTIKAGGRVGIGTEDPATKLEVSGTITATSYVASNSITKNGNEVLDVTATTNDIAASTDKNYVTDAQLSKIVNTPSNTTTDLASKMPKISSNINLELTNGTTGHGSVIFKNTGAPVNENTYKLRAGSGSKLDLLALDDSNAVISTFEFFHNGNLGVPNSITQNSNSVLDTSNILTDINSASGTLIDTPTIKAYVDANAGGSFNGGTITNPITISNGDGTTPLFVGQRTSNLNNIVLMAAKNSENNYVKSIIIDENDGEKIKFLSGNDPDNTALTSILEIGDDIVEVKKVGTALHVNGDIFAFSDGDMAARDISSVRKFSGLDYRISNSLTDSNWALYRATQGNTNGPESTKASDGRSFSGEAVRIRIENDSDKGFIIENSLGLNMFEVNGTTGIVTTANNHDILGALEVKGNGNIVGDLAIGLDVEPVNTLDVYGSLYVTGAALYKSNLTLEDTSQNNYTFERRATGIGLRAESNPTDGSDIFTVESSGNSKRLAVPHLGDVTTSNDGIKVGTESDGTGGRQVLEEGNWALIQSAIHYDTTFPTLTTTDVVGWSGRKIYMIGVGAGTIDLPEIVSSNPTGSQIQVGETFTVFNFNSGSNVTFDSFSTQKFMVDDVSVGNISSNNFNVFSSSKVVFTALDLTGYSNVSDFCWVVTGI